MWEVSYIGHVYSQILIAGEGGLPHQPDRNTFSDSPTGIRLKEMESLEYQNAIIFWWTTFKVLKKKYIHITFTNDI